MSLLFLVRRHPQCVRTLLQCSSFGGVVNRVAKDVKYSTASGREGGLTKSNAKAGESAVGMPLGERIKENTKTASYTGVIVLGTAITGGLFYLIFRELFSSNSPQNIYTDALDRCVNDPQVQDALGQPIKGFGEENSRRRRRHVAHTVYEKEGVKYIRMNFYIQGIRNKATVFLEKKANSSGDFNSFRYLFIQLEYFPKTTIILEDNRQEDNVSPPPAILTPIS